MKSKEEWRTETGAHSQNRLKSATSDMHNYEGTRANVLLTVFVGVHSSVGNIFCPPPGRHSQRR
jgi:hypothetical protein